VQTTCIDNGGDRNVIRTVTAYAGQRNRENVWAIKGASQTNGRRSPIWPSEAPTVRSSARLYVIGTNAAKDWIQSCILKSQPGPRRSQARKKRGGKPSLWGQSRHPELNFAEMS
jgi:phage terminase large subunit GpA-like protein